MNRRRFLQLASTLPAIAQTAGRQPFRLHPDNPHSFLFRGKPTVLVTSGEHYGGVLNLDFDYRRYFRTLASDRLNLTRTFSGIYREVPGSFNIQRNTLAPEPGRFICPWPEVEKSRFDLEKWNEAYFTRLKDFVREAGRNGVVVEFVLFCPYYRDDMWHASPPYVKNNVNGIGDVGRNEVLTLSSGPLLALQERLVRKVTAELRDFDNLYYEICNEPYTRNVPADWEAHIAKLIEESEASFPHRHLIAQNIANGSKKVEKPDSRVGLFNFHYSRPPDCVAMNYDLNRAIGMNETGFDGNGDYAYRIQAWDFVIAGGALYNNLDYSFTAGHEDGTFAYPSTQPGGGSVALRRQLRHLRDFLDRIDFVKMRPAPEVLSGAVEGASLRGLAAPGQAYAVYVHHGRIVKDGKPRYQVDSSPQQIDVGLDLPAGRYRTEWFDTKTGRAAATGRVNHSGGPRRFASPSYREDIALLVRA